MNVPVVSPYGLLQETLWPSEWLVLVSCIMLNCTSRKQVEAVLPTFITNWPVPQKFIYANEDEVRKLLAPLGFANKRTKTLLSMTERYLTGPWEHASELPGIGQYGARAWEIFFKGELGKSPPKDHALVKYWEYCKRLSSP